MALAFSATQLRWHRDNECVGVRSRRSSNLDPRPEYLYQGRSMAHHPELNTRIHSLCEEAHAMLLANLLDTKKVHVLRKRILECAGHARDAGHTDGESQLKLTEEKLMARFPPVSD